MRKETLFDLFCPQVACELRVWSLSATATGTDKHLQRLFVRRGGLRLADTPAIEGNPKGHDESMMKKFEPRPKHPHGAS